MRYTDINCEFCKQPFNEDDDVVVCPICGSPHHRSCWIHENRCANEAIHDDGFEWKFPEGMDPAKKEEKPKKTHGSAAGAFSFKNGETVIECPNCHLLNYENDAFCVRCKAPLKNEQTGNSSNDHQQNSYERIDPRQLAYENQRLYGGLEPNILIDGIPVAEYSDYIGGKAPGKFIRRFAGMERFAKKYSFNFCALILGPIWFFYRKMYKIGAMLLIITTLLGAIATTVTITPEDAKHAKDLINDIYSGKITIEDYYKELTDPQKLPQPDNSTAARNRAVISEIVQILEFGVTLVFALKADDFYRKKAKKDIEASRKECSDMDSYRRTLMLKGGTSGTGLLLGIGAVMVSSFIAELPGLILILMS